MFAWELDAQAQSWVDGLMAELTMEEKLAQLLHPINKGYKFSEWEELLAKVPVGSIFWCGCKPAEFEAKARFIQHKSKIPVLMSGDMEHGALAFSEERTEFADCMALAVRNDPEYLREVGRITAAESRFRGMHWALAPVVDLNLNPENPITNIRALGDDPDKTIPLLRAFIEGMQSGNALAACCKHFPGDGVDNRDQHMVTSCNYLPFEQWKSLYGRVWQAAIDAGTLSIMCGHISLPDYQGYRDDPDAAMPATLSRELQTDLLRNELGFKGVIVSDALPMTGFTSRLPESDLAWMNIQTGSDSLLFSDPVKDYQWMLDALKAGKLTGERVEESCRRILTMKAQLNLHKDCFGTAPTADERKKHQLLAEKTSDESVCLIRSNPAVIPVAKEKLKKVLTISLIRSDYLIADKDLATVDSELSKRGIEVDHMLNPDREVIREIYEKYDRIFVNMTNLSHANLALRLTGSPSMFFWHYKFNDLKNKFVFTSFGSPYILRDQPYLDNLLCVWGITAVSQKSAVKAWLGEIPMDNPLPVRPAKTRIKAFEF